MFTEKRSKYNATKKTVDGIKFDSTKEANRYSELKLLQHYGYIKDLQCQVKYELIPKQLKRNGKYGYCIINNRCCSKNRYGKKIYFAKYKLVK